MLEDKRLPMYGDLLAAWRVDFVRARRGMVRRTEARMEERRRSPRHQVGGDFVNLPANMSVRVIDISSAGVLLQSAHLLNPGSRGSLRFTLAGAPFAADIQVQRVTTSAEAGSGYRIGATFVAMTPENRRHIERFINND